MHVLLYSTGMVWNELICGYANVLHTSGSFRPHTHTHARTHIHIPFEDHELTRLKVEIAVFSWRKIYCYILDVHVSVSDHFALHPYKYFGWLQFLPVPELMAIRLTRQIVNIGLPLKVKGMLENTMVHVLRALRQNHDLLLATMDVFVKEVSVDWTVRLCIVCTWLILCAQY